MAHLFSVDFNSIGMTSVGYVASLFKLVMWYVAKLLTLQGIVMQWVITIPTTQLFWDCFGAGLLVVLFVVLWIRFLNNKDFTYGLGMDFYWVCSFGLMAFMDMNKGPLLEPHWFVLSFMGFCLLSSLWMRVYSKFE